MRRVFGKAAALLVKCHCHRSFDILWQWKLHLPCSSITMYIKRTRSDAWAWAWCIFFLSFECVIFDATTCASPTPRQCATNYVHISFSCSSSEWPYIFFSLEWLKVQTLKRCCQQPRWILFPSILCVVFSHYRKFNETENAQRCQSWLHNIHFNINNEIYLTNFSFPVHVHHTSSFTICFSFFSFFFEFFHT